MLPMIFLYIVIVINGTLIRRYGNVEMVASKNTNIQPSPAHTHVFGFSGPSYYGADACEVASLCFQSFVDKYTI